jgi:hypothetical protein
MVTIEEREPEMNTEISDLRPITDAELDEVGGRVLALAAALVFGFFAGVGMAEMTNCNGLRGETGTLNPRLRG